MRDYVRVFGTQDSMPIVQFGAVSFYWFQTPEACQSFIDSFAGSSPGGGTLSEIKPVWFRLNAEKVTSWLNSSLIQNLGPDLLSSGKQMTFLESPRSLGVNSVDEGTSSQSAAGGSKANSGDFSGASGLIDFINSLPAYAALLKRQGRPRDAGIVLSVYNQIISGKISITDGLAILRENNL